MGKHSVDAAGISILNSHVRWAMLNHMESHFENRKTSGNFYKLPCLHSYFYS